MREPNDVTPCDAAEVTRWDDAADVIVVGFGAAGSAAAFTAAAAGAEVLVTERTGGPGGAAALAEGIVYLGGGTPIQTACGFEDSPRRHVPLHDGRLRPRSRRGQDRPLLRGEPGPFRLAGRAGRPVRPDLLRRHLHGARPAPRASSTRVARTPTRSTRSPARRPGATWPRRSARRGGCSCSTWRPPPPGPARPSRPTPGSTASSRRRPGRRRPGAALRRDGDAAGPPRRGAHRGRLHLQRRHAAPALPALGPGHVQGRHRG